MSQVRQLLTVRDFRYMWGSQILCDFGDSLTSLTLLILIQRLTGSTVAMAGLMISIALPTLVFGLLAGVYVDRVDRKKAMMASDLLRALIVLGFLLVRSEQLLPIIYLIAFAQATVGTVFNPARNAFLPAVVGRERLLAANSVSQTSKILFNLLGVGAAGLLAAFGPGLGLAFIVNSAIFLVSFLLIRRMRTSGMPEETASPRVWLEMRAGFRVMLSSRPLRGVLVSLSVTMLGLGALNVLFVPFLIGDLGVSEAFLGAVEASQVVGLVVSGTVVAALASRLRPASLVSLGLTALSLFVGFIAASQSVWQVMILLFFVGLSVGPVQAGASTLSQTLIEDSMRGRVGGAVSTLVSAANLISMGLAGVAAATIGIRNVFLASGCLILLAGLLTLWLLREQRLPAPRALTGSVSEGV